MDIQPIFRCAVGMDVHLAVVHVCVILQEAGCEPEVHRRQFDAFQRDRRTMAEWIAGFAPDTVVMESTGIYWKSPYAALEKVGIRALVVNAQPTYCLNDRLPLATTTDNMVIIMTIRRQSCTFTVLPRPKRISAN